MTTYHDQPLTLAAPLGLYTHVASSPPGTLVAVAGQTGVTPTGALAGDGSPEAQTAQAFANLELALASVGALPVDVLKTTTYLVGRDTIAPFMAARRVLFSAWYPDGRYPPNTLLVVQGLVEVRFVVEIEAFAVVGAAAPVG